MRLKVFFSDGMTSTPFTKAHRNASLSYLKWDEVTDPQSADLVMAQTLHGMRHHFNLKNKQYYIWTAEPFWLSSDANQIEDESTGLVIPVSTAFNGDAYLTPVEFFPFKALPWTSDKMAPLATSGKKECCMLATFRLKADRYVGGNNVDLCELRQNLARELQSKFDFCDIYGRSWPQGTRIVEDSRGGDWSKRKLEVLRGYRFNICVENTITRNYVTEKLWQAMEAGVVPVYWSRGNNILEAISPTSFVDLSAHADAASLHDTLSGMSETTYRSYLQSMAEDWNRILRDYDENSLNKNVLDRIQQRVAGFSA